MIESNASHPCILLSKYRFCVYSFYLLNPLPIVKLKLRYEYAHTNCEVELILCFSFFFALGSVFHFMCWSFMTDGAFQTVITASLIMMMMVNVNNSVCVSSSIRSMALLHRTGLCSEVLLHRIPLQMLREFCAIKCVLLHRILNWKLLKLLKDWGDMRNFVWKFPFRNFNIDTDVLYR